MYNVRCAKIHYKEGDIAKVHAPCSAMDIDGETKAMTQKQRCRGVIK